MDIIFVESSETKASVCFGGDKVKLGERRFVEEK